MLKFIVDYLQYLAATLYHILEYLNSLPAFAAVISQLTLMSVLEHYILYTTITIYCKQNTFLFRSESCFADFLLEGHTVNAEYYAYCAVLSD